MHLTINGEEINYSLESEKTLAEVLQGVQAWLGSAGFVINGIRADGRDLLSIPPNTWGPTSVDSVAELKVMALHTADVRIEHWQTLDAWLGMLADEVKAPGPVLEELLSNLPETIEGVRANPFLPAGSDALRRLSAMFDGQGPAEIRRWPAERRQEARDLIDWLREELARRIDDSARPQDAIARCIADLRAHAARLTEVSVLLQTGKDKTAMETVVGFTDSVQSVLALVPFLPPSAERGRMIADLTPVLRNLVSAFDAKDSVLIGDLLEYEIAPRIEKLMPLLVNAPGTGAGMNAPGTGAGMNAPGTGAGETAP